MQTLHELSDGLTVKMAELLRAREAGFSGYSGELDDVKLLAQTALDAEAVELANAVNACAARLEHLQAERKELSAEAREKLFKIRQGGSRR